jgi:putative membrane protein
MKNRTETLQQPPNLKLAKTLKIANWLITAAVLILVVLMRQVKIPLPEGFSFAFLPPIYSTVNALAAVLLVVALVMIKRGIVSAHKLAINGAMICSLLFLLCYVLYHFTNEETRFGGEGLSKIIYLLLLISHIVLAAASLPFILLTWSYGVTNQFDKHRRLAKWVFPVWLYVAVTGPVCYLMLRPYY